MVCDEHGNQVTMALILVQGEGPRGPLMPVGLEEGACALLGRGGRPPSPSWSVKCCWFAKCSAETAESEWSECTVD